jgi:ElaB/YqjD/DUF883 family membrane-anchored ribosome-binding protein
MQIKSNVPEPEGNGKAAAAAAACAPSGMSREFQNFIADIEDLIKATTSLTGEEVARARAKLSKRVAAAKESIEDFGDAVADQARHTAKATNSYVHENPWQAIGIGAVLGLLLGVALTRQK